MNSLCTRRVQSFSVDIYAKNYSHFFHQKRITRVRVLFKSSEKWGESEMAVIAFQSLPNNKMIFYTSSRLIIEGISCVKCINFTKFHFWPIFSKFNWSFSGTKLHSNKRDIAFIVTFELFLHFFYL